MTTERNNTPKVLAVVAIVIGLLLMLAVLFLIKRHNAQIEVLRTANEALPVLPGSVTAPVPTAEEALSPTNAEIKLPAPHIVPTHPYQDGDYIPDEKLDVEPTEPAAPGQRPALRNYLGVAKSSASKR